MKKDKVSRGFVTLATGRDEYYLLAHYLLLSYRFHTRSDVPFAVICDRENEYTSDFDKVVVMDNPKFSVFDKMRLPELAPFDETIFIEADCLAYRDLNGLWDVFGNSPDFGGLGIILPIDSDEGWIPSGYLGPYQGRFEHQFIHQGGVYFMRKNRLGEFIRTCEDIYLHREEFHFKLPNEEPVFILACMVHGFEPVTTWTDVFCFFPAVKLTKADIKRGLLRFEIGNHYFVSWPGLYLLHWGTENTRKPLYLKEAETVRSLIGQGRHAGRLIPLRIKIETCLRRVGDFLKPLVPSPVRVFLKSLLSSS